MKKFHYLLLIVLLVTQSCKKEADEKEAGSGNSTVTSSQKIGAILTENFESGTKTAYAVSDVTLLTGLWNLNDALIGNTASDAKAGLQSARVRNSGKLTMKFDFLNGSSTVSVKHAKYGTDANGTWELWYSTNSGVSYIQAGTAVTTSTTTLAIQNFTINVSGAFDEYPFQASLPLT